MATKNTVRPFTATVQVLDMVRDELPRGASIATCGALLQVFDVCGKSGITAKDVQILTKESLPTVSRMLKTFLEGSLIAYQQYERMGPKVIHLTPKGEALKQRAYQAMQDTAMKSQLQQEIIDENVRKGIEREKAAERKDIQAQYKAEGRGALGEIGQVNVEVSEWADDVAHLRESKRRGQIADAVAYHTGDQLKAEIYELKAGRSSFVADQIIRARRNAVKTNSNGFEWRKHMIEVFDPKYGWEQKYDLQRLLVKGVWFYYNLDEDADKHLPVAVQRDYDPDEFRQFIDSLEATLSQAVDDESVPFSMIMKDTKDMLNSVQYNKARDILTRHVADISTDFMKQQMSSELDVEDAEQTAGALHSFANDPRVSKDEQAQFRYDAYAADRRAADAREENENLKEKLNAQQAQIDELYKLLRGEND